MAHLFISYSRRDIEYVRRLVDSLLERGFDVWFDAHIEYGDNWESAIVQAIDQASAVLVIMSPDAASSAWVPRELAYAENQGKPIFPLLLAGEVFPRLILTQFANVRDAALPRDEFYAALTKILPPKSGRGEEVHIDIPMPRGFVRTTPTSAVQERRLESAMPRQTARAIPTEVRVKISKLDTQGLRGELPDLTEYGDEIKKDDVRAATFPLTFPRAADGALLPVSACIQVSSEQYAVQYPANPCGEGAAEVEIQPDHDTRTIIFTLMPRDAAYVGRAAVMVRLVVEGRVIAENLVATRISERVTESSFALATVTIPPVTVREGDAMSAPTRPVATLDISKTVQSSAPTVPIHIDKRLSTAAPPPARPAAPTTRATQAVPKPAAAPPPQRARKSGGGMMRYGGLLGILLAGIVGVLVLSNTRFGLFGTAALETGTQRPIAQQTSSSSNATLQALATERLITGIVGSGDTSADSPPDTWIGDPVQGLTHQGTLAFDTQLTILSKAQVNREWFLEVTPPDGSVIWIAADDVTLSDGATLSSIPEWEA